MSSKDCKDLSGESSEDSRLRYSRRAVISGLFAAGVLVGFRKPVDLLGQPSGDAEGHVSSTDKRATKEAGQRDDAPREDRAGADDTNSAGPDEDAREAEQKEPKEEPPPPENPTMRMYIPRLGIRGHTVREGDSEEVMALGAMKLPSTGSP